MWTLGYKTKNLQAPQNTITQGQCGGECAVWIANMYNRKSSRDLADTSPEERNTAASIATHLAGLSVPASWYSRDPTSGKLKPDIKQLWPQQANMRMVAAAGLKPDYPAVAEWELLANWLTDGKSAFGYGGYFIDIGGHAIATFVTSKKTKALATYEAKRNLYFFDPNEGCYYSDNEENFLKKFEEIDKVYPFVLKHYLKKWNYIKVRSIKFMDNTDGYDTDVSSLFGG